ncbi:hypothetical protein [Streptomyces sp. NRRL B-1347]|uniref:hypothetical protein n=1 Tax=Streptomyces sp. NRRL B-1347 TaxID=1476877 RepID=UPI0004CA8022|nr:hypothetical protein [Streptomyces sp. NRRL B-1347]
MRRGLLHAGAWSLATGAAVTLSWWGVHTVMAGTAYDPPRALPLAAEHPEGAVSSSTHRPEPEPAVRPSKPSRSAAAPEPSRKPPKSPKPPKPRDPAPRTSPPAKPPPGQVKTYSTDGGRVVFDLGGDAATLVSASPATGWSMQVWKAPAWIRVEFTSGADRVSVFCAWHDRAPRVDVTTY